MVVDVIVFVVVVLNVVVVLTTLKVDLRLLLMEVEFGWGGWWCANPYSCQTQLS